MPNHASGTFEVKLSPEGPEDKTEDSTLGRMTIAKQFRGDLQGNSQGQMLFARTGVKTSAGYVAVERITGSLHGRNGSFILQHNGIMSANSQQQNVVVVPDSGAGQLAGIAGAMKITIADGKHSYDLEYTLPEGSE